jgi:hypothetical protein
MLLVAPERPRSTSEREPTETMRPFFTPTASTRGREASSVMNRPTKIVSGAAERVLDVFVDHYNGHRPHRALALTPPRPARPPILTATERGEAGVVRRDRLGGVVHEYVLAA